MSQFYGVWLRLVLDWWLDLLDSLIHCVTTPNISLLCTSVRSHMFTSRCLVAASIGGHLSSPGFLSSPWPQLSVSNSNSSQWLNHSTSLTHPHLCRLVTISQLTNGRSFSLSLCQAPIWAQYQIFVTVTLLGLLKWRALSNKRTGLSFKIAAGPCQCNHSQGLVDWLNWCWPSSAESFLTSVLRYWTKIFILS
jgi:hypothetical protein